MRNNAILKFATVLLLLTGLCQGGYDQSGGTGAENLSMAEFASLGSGSQTEGAVLIAGAPQDVATDLGTELAIYSDRAPPSTELRKLQSLDLALYPPTYIYFYGGYLGWNDFKTTFSPSSAGLWIERAAGWSWYATMPLGGWAHELLYVPVASPLSMYELYPMGFVMRYDLGNVKPGYYQLWFYADTPGRHRSVFSTSSGHSNSVIIDVYPIREIIPKPNPVRPTPKEECEKNPYCRWVNGNCLCVMPDPDEPQRKECEKNPYCHWVNGDCLCVMPDPDDPAKRECERNPNCDYVNGQCYCRGIPPVEPEPIPGPVPNPDPEPMPDS